MHQNFAKNQNNSTLLVNRSTSIVKLATLVLPVEEVNAANKTKNLNSQDINRQDAMRHESKESENFVCDTNCGSANVAPGATLEPPVSNGVMLNITVLKQTLFFI